MRFHLPGCWCFFLFSPYLKITSSTIIEIKVLDHYYVEPESSEDDESEVDSEISDSDEDETMSKDWNISNFSCSSTYRSSNQQHYNIIAEDVIMK